MDPEDKNPPRLSNALDGFLLRTGRITSWLNGILVVVIIVQVVLRYVFGRGLVSLEELQWHLYAIGIMIGIPYCIVTNSHIRLDLLHQGFTKRRQEKVEILGILLLLMPMIVVVFWHSLDFLDDAWRINERSDAPMGLCCRWFIKAFIPIGFGLLFLAAFSRLIRAFKFLKKP